MSKRQAKKPPREDTLERCIRSLSAELEQKLQTFLLAAGEDANLTGAERRRLRSAGVRNYGFIDDVNALAAGKVDGEIVVRSEAPHPIIP